ncbi:hypothetical protein JW916_14485 [Candidatus Sumerlaeota bacterium]|nr:hypothetical protein [Candidatus Sumerlaeota bacterium]
MAVVVIAGVWFLFSSPSKTPDAQVQRDRQADPEKACVYYLETAYKFIHNEVGGNFDDVERAVTKEDWQWYMNNYDRIFKEGDSFNVSGATDPNVMAKVARRAVLEQVLESGPNRPDNQIVDRRIGDNNAVLTVRVPLDVTGMIDAGIEVPEEDTYVDREVEVIKEGKFWKVRGFAGGRARIDR